jgi:hypothetical protein
MHSALLDGFPQAYHVPLDIKEATNAPVTEHFTFWMTSIPDGYKEGTKPFWARMEQESVVQGLTTGWAEETPEVDGQKTHVYMGLIGWTSVEEHMAYRESDAFTQNVSAIRAPTVIKRTMVHVKFQ